MLRNRGIMHEYFAKHACNLSVILCEQCGFSFTNIADLVVFLFSTDPPEFDPSSSINVETSLYKRAEIKCIASGNPTPSLTMSFGKKNVGGTLTNASNKTSLTVSFNVTKDSLGDYTCNASNRVNNVQRLIKVYSMYSFFY